MAKINMCAKCAKVLKEPKHCAKCNSVNYCSKQCQKDDWKTHKKECASLAAARANNEPIDYNKTAVREFTSSLVLNTIVSKPFTKLKNKTWLHGRSDQDVYKLLVDAYRFRKLEEYDCARVTEILDLDPEVSSGLAPFQSFVNDAKEKGLLPTGWTNANTNACMAYGLDKKNWSTLTDLWVKEEKYVEHYGSPKMLAQFSFFGIQVLGLIGNDGERDEEDWEELLDREVKMEARRR